MAHFVLLGLCISMVAAVNPRLTKVIATRGLAAEPLKARTAACTEINAEGGSVPGVSYYNGQPNGCPIINAIDPDGSCSSHMTTALDHCAAYCEVRNYFTYGQEVPFPSATCQQDDPGCGISTTHSVTVTQTFSFNVGAALGKKRSKDVAFLTSRDDPAESVLKASFNAGASYSYSSATSNSVAVAHSHPTNETECGYWTAVPVFITSCGTLTTAPLTYVINPTNELPTYRRAENSLCDNTKKVTTPNWCNTTPLKDSNGNQEAQTIFVLTDCNGNALLPACQQDAVFQYPGVARTNLPSC